MNYHEQIDPRDLPHTPSKPWIMWNRSSAFTPEQLGALNGAIGEGVQHAIVLFEKDLAQMDITDDERADVRAGVFPIIAQNVTDGIAEFAEKVIKSL